MHATSPINTDSSSPDSDGLEGFPPQLAMPTLLAALQQLLSKPHSNDAHVSDVEESAVAHNLAWLVLATLCTPSASSQAVVDTPTQQQEQLVNSTLVHNNALLAEELAALHAGGFIGRVCVVMTIIITHPCTSSSQTMTQH